MAYLNTVSIKVLSLYLEARIRIRIKETSRIRIRIKWQPGSVSALMWQAWSGSASMWCGSATLHKISSILCMGIGSVTLLKHIRTYFWIRVRWGRKVRQARLGCKHNVHIFTRDETGLVCLPTQLERTLQSSPLPHKAELILPSWLNVRQKAAVASLCTLWLDVLSWFLIISDLEDEDDWSVNDEPQVTVWRFSLLFLTVHGIF